MEPRTRNGSSPGNVQKTHEGSSCPDCGGRPRWHDIGEDARIIRHRMHASQEKLSTTRYPKMDITNSRSMELFRKLGLSKLLRDVAVPETNNFDVSWITSFPDMNCIAFDTRALSRRRRSSVSAMTAHSPWSRQAGLAGRHRAGSEAGDRRGIHRRCTIRRCVRGARSRSGLP